ncbi:MAG TPA: phosphatase PAP2 family protein [Clostridiales bacterium]|nr:phosphatase PAP2 family protein [Clostridiales bacterium]
MKRKREPFHQKTASHQKQDGFAFTFLVILFLFFSSLLIFSGFIGNYIAKEDWEFDRMAISFMNRIRSQMLTHLFKGITFTGNFLSVVIITLVIAGVLIYFKKTKQALFFSLNVLGLWLFNEMLKQVFRRPRPLEPRLVHVSGYSFPSGHSMVFMGLSAWVIYYILRNVRNRRMAVLISILILIYAVLVGLSRVYLGVHYFSDVLAGWTIGILWVLASISLHKKLELAQNDKKI